MANVEIVNQVKGKNKELGRVWAAALSEEIEKIARREAARNKVDLGIRNALFKEIARVMARPELMKEAQRLAKERLEAEGKVPKEDEKIVKHR